MGYNVDYERLPFLNSLPNSIVEILSKKNSSINRGTGIIIPGYILTATHSIDPESLFWLYGRSGQNKLYSEMGYHRPPASWRTMDTLLDDVIALPIPDTWKQIAMPLPLAQHVPTFQSIEGFLIGYPSRDGYPHADSPSMYYVRIYAKDDYLQCAFPGADDPRGLSGGAFINMYGELLGIATEASDKTNEYKIIHGIGIHKVNIF